jgi:pantetheine-phosphate adenylyltransferase
MDGKSCGGSGKDLSVLAIGSPRDGSAPTFITGRTLEGGVVAPEDPSFAHVCMGGTFSPLHRGHRALLARALTIGEQVFVGVTSGDLARRGRERKVPAVEDRIAGIEAFLSERSALDRVEVAPIEDPFGRALEPRFEAIVVSPETSDTAEAINAERRKRDLDPLAVDEVPFVLGLDGQPVNGTRVARGEIDPEGLQPRSVQLAVGSANPVKVEASEQVFGRFVPTVDAWTVDVETGVSEQPRDAEGPKGAATRARNALAASDEAGLGVGIEAALVDDEASGETFDVQYAAIADAQGRVTTGAGPGFSYPPGVLSAVEEGRTIGEVFDALEDRAGVGQAEGAIGVLTGGAATRTELTEWAVLSALVPRLQPDWYRPLPGEELDLG